MNDYVFAGVGIHIEVYVCEQLPGANSSPIVTKLGQSYPWPHGTRWLNFGMSRSKVKVKVGGGGMRSTERSSSSTRCPQERNIGAIYLGENGKL